MAKAKYLAQEIEKKIGDYQAKSAKRGIDFSIINLIISPIVIRIKNKCPI